MKRVLFLLALVCTTMSMSANNIVQADKAQQYTDQANRYMRQAEDYAKDGDYDRSRMYTNWANDALSKAQMRMAWAREARDKARMRTRWAEDAMRR